MAKNTLKVLSFIKFVMAKGRSCGFRAPGQVIIPPPILVPPHPTEG